MDCRDRFESFDRIDFEKEENTIVLDNPIKIIDDYMDIKE